MVGALLVLREGKAQMETTSLPTSLLGRVQRYLLPGFVCGGSARGREMIRGDGEPCAAFTHFRRSAPQHHVCRV